jgi:hypothetical protein
MIVPKVCPIICLIAKITGAVEPTAIGEEVKDEQDIALNLSILKNRMKGGPGRKRAHGRNLAGSGYGSASGTEYGRSNS